MIIEKNILFIFKIPAKSIKKTKIPSTMPKHKAEEVPKGIKLLSGHALSPILSVHVQGIGTLPLVASVRNKHFAIKPKHQALANGDA